MAEGTRTVAEDIRATAEVIRKLTYKLLEPPPADLRRDAAVAAKAAATAKATMVARAADAAQAARASDEAEAVAAAAAAAVAEAKTPAAKAAAARIAEDAAGRASLLRDRAGVKQLIAEVAADVFAQVSTYSKYTDKRAKAAMA
eukprot:TRINITY_DN140_c0_g1_i20.p1 TRINITY_DN140_c0_g1~~TRINITY_DN140_c0_g1_i20.p1  ORF type:complete len:157 (+),score=62.75 TRINITY_DN140_c0_g1_i20:41-472(+)